jgi:MFS family permease
MSTSEAVASSSEDREARRNALILASAGAFVGAAPTMVFALGGLAGMYLLPPDQPALATLPLSFYVVGAALSAIPAAQLMSRIGRRAGFMVGALISAVGGATAGFAVLQASFVLLVIGLAIVGVANAFTQQYRFAAADSGSPQVRAKAISWVLAGGVASGIIGPQTVIFTRHLFDPIPFAGGFFAMILLAAIGGALLVPLSGAARRAPPPAARTGGRPLSEIIRQPRFIVSLICAIGSYGLMSLVMTAAPLAMVGCGLSQDDAALGIQWHVLAMFASSFITGALIARFGVETIVGVGLTLLAACAVVALLGIDVMHFWAALILVGIGWNFGFIGATTMLTETYRPEERSRVQGFNDFVLFSFVALASFSSGQLYATVGWSVINIVVFPIVAVCALALLIATFALRRRPPTAPAA